MMEKQSISSILPGRCFILPVGRRFRCLELREMGVWSAILHVPLFGEQSPHTLEVKTTRFLEQSQAFAKPQMPGK